MPRTTLKQNLLIRISSDINHKSSELLFIFVPSAPEWLLGIIFASCVLLTGDSPHSSSSALNALSAGESRKFDENGPNPELPE